MKNIPLIMLSLVVVGSLAFIALGTPKDGVKSDIDSISSSFIEVEKTFHDFGDIGIFNGKVDTTYSLKNTGDEDVKIVSGVTSCMCTEGEIDDLRFGMHEITGNSIIIPAGGEKTLTAIFDPLAHGPNGTGLVRRDLYLKTNSEITPEIRVQFSANVVKEQ